MNGCATPCMAGDGTCAGSDGDFPEAFQERLKFYKENGIESFSGCTTIQKPIRILRRIRSLD